MMMGFGEGVDKLKEYVDALEKELRKIEVFQRELPLAVQLLRHAIEACKQQMVADNLFSGPSDGEVTSKEGPVLEEFIPLKRSEEGSTCRCDGDDHDRPATKKPDWLKSVQLWTQDASPPAKQERRSLIEPKKSSGAFQPFCKEDRSAKAAVPATMAASSTADNEVRAAKDSQAAQRKSRRCWSPELHKRFLHALDQLGGSHAATPKQIRELMMVDGLTNDEVKSHLQKYRLHHRRPSCLAAQSNTSNNPQAPQFVVVYAAAAVPTAATNQPAEAADGQGKEIYTPKATLPSSGRQHQEMLQLSSFGPVHSGGRSCCGGANSNSPATSTTSHVTATSPIA